MLRITFMVLRLFLKVPYYFYKIWWYGKSSKYTEEEKFNVLKYVTKKANSAGRVKIEPFGIENIPKENGFIYFPNHQGLFDVLTVLETSPNPFAIVMKKEVANTIIVKQVLILLKGQSIDREDVRQSMKVIMKMTEEVKSGRNYLIFAEGTRSRNKNELLDFKGGSFKSAMNAKCPIVPIALINSFAPFDIKSIKPVTVQIHYLQPILYDEYKDKKTCEVAKMVKERIQEVIKQNEENSI